MRKFLHLFVVAVFFFGSVAFAQENQEKKASCPTSACIETLIEKLQLSKEQAQKLRAIPTEDKKVFEEQLKSVLTPAQFAQYEQFKSEKIHGKKSCCSTKGKDAKGSCCSKKGKDKGSCCSKKMKDKKGSCCSKKSDKKKSCHTEGDKKADSKACCKK